VQEVRFAGGAIHVRIADKLTALSLLARHLGLLRPPEARETAETNVDAAIAAAEAAGRDAHLRVFLEDIPREVRDRMKAVLRDHWATQRAGAQREAGDGAPGG
jgi:hypothetical protein